MTTSEKKLREVKAEDLFVKVVYRPSDGSEGGSQFNCYPDLEAKADTVGDDEWTQRYDYEYRKMSDEACLYAADLSTDEINDSKRLDVASKGVEETAALHGMKVVGAREFLQTVSDRHFAQQAEMTKSYLDRAENRRAADAAESNARLEKLEASRAAERSQKNAQTPRLSM